MATVIDSSQPGEPLPPTPEASGSTPESTQSDQAADGTSKKRDIGPTTAERRTVRNISYWAVGWLSLVHLIAFTAPWTFTWAGLAVAIGLHWMTGSLGICLCYHRLLTHTGMKTPRWLRNGLTMIGALAGEGAPIDWVANHRKHHACSDQEGDPHSPHDGTIWSHIFWLAYNTHNGERKDYLQRWAPDLYKDPFMRRMDALFLPLHLVTGLVLFGIGYAIGGLALGTSLLVWGMFVRLVGVLHATWMVNSASHLWGYKNYETTDDSRNNWLVAIVAYGEGWHNNHHAYPRMAMHGHRWWEFDMTWQAVRLLRFTGLAWDVVDYRNAAEKKQKAAAGDDSDQRQAA